MAGFFLTLEGVEGVGKSTNLAFIEDWMRSQQVNALMTREPGGTPLAEEIRQLLLSPRAEVMSADCELLMVFAARAQHWQQVIQPALAAGRTVVSDRFVDATYAYQGFGRGLSLERIAQLESLVMQGRQPDLTLFLDLDVATGLKRAQTRGAPDRFEQENTGFFERVRQGYWARIQAQPERFAVIDAAAPLADVQAAIAAVLQARFLPSGAA